MPNLVWRIEMKVKEITLSEDVTAKPIPNAMQIAVDGKPVAQSSDPAIAQQITQAAKDGKLTLNDPTKTQMGSQGAAIQEQPASDPQMTALQQLLATARQPWEQAQIKWRMSNLQSQQDLAGEPGVSGPPVDARGNLIPVLPTKEWMAKNPNVVKQLPNEALPPEMQRPGMIDRIRGLAGIK